MPPHWSTWTPLQGCSHTLGIFRWPDSVPTGTNFNLYGSYLTPLTHSLTDYFSWRCSPTLPIISKFPMKLSLHGYDRLALHDLFHTKYALLHGPTFHCSLNPSPHGTQPPLSATPPKTNTSSIVANSKWVTLKGVLCQGDTRKDGAPPALFLTVVFLYVFLCCSMHFCVVLCIVCSVTFSV
jgi:hypothetical protein